jgi:hypothetical protein
MHDPAFATLGIYAAAWGESVQSVANLEKAFPALCRRLVKFKAANVLSAIGGLLTVPQYHPNTARLEALAHLTARWCKGYVTPSSAQIREWLNDILLNGEIGRVEDPPEDVFISNVSTWWGNIRIFEGTWEANDFGLASLLSALRVLWRGEPPITGIRSLLLLSEALASRAGIRRYHMSDGTPRALFRFGSATLDSWRARARFTPTDLKGLGITRADLAPFIFDLASREALSKEPYDQSSLVRRPLVEDGSVPRCAYTCLNRRQKEAGFKHWTKR